MTTDTQRMGRPVLEVHAKVMQETSAGGHSTSQCIQDLKVEDIQVGWGNKE
jgi:hypothetical protein